jgi:hypothetical protein
VLDLPAGDDLVGDLDDAVRRGREANARARALVGGRLVVRLDLVVEAEHLRVGVEQRAAGVARVDCRVGLDCTRDVEAVRRRDRAARLADDPRGTVSGRPNGLPIATTWSPTLAVFELANLIGCSSDDTTSTLITAMSVDESVPSTLAETCLPSSKVTLTEVALATTCSSVRMSPRVS